MALEMEVSLARFNTQCRGVKFYDLAEVGVEVGNRVLFRRNPYHVKDKNCVEVRLAAKSGMMLGHMAAEVAKTLSPLLLRRLHLSG
jgi:hypothetical protein